MTAITLVGLSLSLAAGPALADPADLRARMQRVLEDHRVEYGLPGATAAIALADGTVVAVAVGMADVENRLPMSTRSRMLAASIGKSIVGALVLALESEGHLRRDDLVSRHLAARPWFDRLPNSKTMTVRHLLNHTAGLPDHVHLDGMAPRLMQLGQEPHFDPEDVVAFVFDADPLFEPGSAWSYTDTGYLLVGLVIEAATGRDVFDLATERFLRPLGLARTGPSNARTLDGLAVGYTAEDNPFGLPARTMDGEGSLVWNPAVEWTGGGFASTSGDLALWGHALFGGHAMEQAYLDRLLEGVAVHPDAIGITYGAGVAVYAETEFGPAYGHGGWIPGYVSSLRHYADHGVTVAFQVNTDVGVADDSADFVAQLEVALARIATQR